MTTFSTAPAQFEAADEELALALDFLDVCSDVHSCERKYKQEKNPEHCNPTLKKKKRNLNKGKKYFFPAIKDLRKYTNN